MGSRVLSKGDIVVFNNSKYEIDTIVSQNSNEVNGKPSYSVEFISKDGKHIKWDSKVQGGYVLFAKDLFHSYCASLKNILSVCRKQSIKKLNIDCNDFQIDITYAGIRGNGKFSLYSGTLDPVEPCNKVSTELLSAFKLDVRKLVILNQNICSIRVDINSSNPNTLSVQKKRVSGGYEDVIYLHLSK